MGRIKGELAEGYIRIKGEKIREEIKKRGLSLCSLSTFILNQDKTSLSSQIRAGSMSEEKFNRLMDYLRISEKNREEYLAKEIVAPPTEKKVTKESPVNQETLDLLVVGVNTLYETQAEANRIFKDILQEIKVSNQKLERIEKKVNTIENATGQILSKEIISNEKTDDILKNLQDVKSTINIIKGRTTDINDICKKRSFKAV